MKLAILTPIWQRPEVYRIYKQAIFRLIDSFPKIDFKVIIIGSESKVSFALTPKEFHYIEWFNIPLGKKFQVGLDYAKTLNPDYVMILGSDDLVSNSAMRAYEKEFEKKTDYIAFCSKHFYNADTRQASYWPGYVVGREGEPAGSGRTLSKKLLDSLNWDLWNTGLNTGLDRSMTERLKDKKLKVIKCSKEKIFNVSIKTACNINVYTHWQPVEPYKLLKSFPELGCFIKEEKKKIVKVVKKENKFEGKVINITSNDWANFGYGNYLAMKSAGIDCKMFKLKPHKYKYKNQAPIILWEQMQWEVDKADVVQIFFTADSFIDLAKSCGKKIIIYHAGSNYRMNIENYNRIWNPIVEKTVICLGEFHNQGAKNEEYMIWGQDLSAKYTSCEKKLIGHYPSDVEVKGTDKIMEMMSQVPGANFDCKTDKVSNREHLKRIAGCDIYVELFKPELWGKPYGSWGITGLDAANMGKIVVTNHVHSEVYEKTYGKCGMLVVNTEEEFISLMRKLIKMSPKELKEIQKKTREWYLKNHSLQATGKRIENMLLEI